MLTLRPEIDRVPRAKVDRALVDLHRALGESKVLTTEEACERSSHDESEATRSIADAIVVATHADDVRKTLEICARHVVAVSPRGAGTGRSGGSVPVAGGVVLAMEGMNDLKEISREDLLVVCGPGLITGALHAAVEAEGLFYPPDPNS
ncbi:MAG: FAD-binding oxidoreductase, partial [Polyangiales bacterium]